MSASLREDYAMSMTSVAAFRDATRNIDHSKNLFPISQEDLRFIDGGLSAKKIPEEESRRHILGALKNKSKIGFEFEDIQKEVRSAFLTAAKYMRRAHKSDIKVEAPEPSKKDEKP